MSHYYAYCYCRECLKMDLEDRNRYDTNEAYCTEFHQYFNPNSKACSNHFVYDENRGKVVGGCYITTAICDILRMDDDNSYLEKLRSFRENYMRGNVDSILAEYDVVGPIICKSLLEDNLKEIKSLMMFENYIKPIVTLLDNKQYTEAILKYEQMTNELMNEYNIAKTKININEIDKTDIGKGHRLRLIKQNI